MMQWSKVTVSLAAVGQVDLQGVRVGERRPSRRYSVMLFFFIRKWTPLTRPSATLRLRVNAAP